ncbi:MAG: hypothetical protein ACT6RD_09870 [Brevundimonas sp.]|uniref:hypothetical protein n=1 Tax=Brevundimonas sp. TaxID=1871086 RepID=UPI0040338962
MATQLVLPSRLEGAALSVLRDDLMSRRGDDLDLLAQDVDRINGLGLELLLRAFNTWREEGHRLRVLDPSTCVLAAFTTVQRQAALAGGML